MGSGSPTYYASLRAQSASWRSIGMRFGVIAIALAVIGCGRAATSKEPDAGIDYQEPHIDCFPAIESVTPTLLPLGGGTEIVIRGSQLCPAEPGDKLVVELGGAIATVTSSSDTEMHVIAPKGSVAGPVV